MSRIFDRMVDIVLVSLVNKTSELSFYINKDVLRCWIVCVNSGIFHTRELEIIWSPGQLCTLKVTLHIEPFTLKINSYRQPNFTQLLFSYFSSY